MEVLEDIPVRIDKGEVLRLQGYKGGVIKAGVDEVVEHGIEEGRRLVGPRAIYTQVMIRNVGRSEMALDNGVAISPGGALKLWRGADHLVVALCTIGSALEDRVAELFAAGEYPDALVLDCVGSVAVESASDYVNYVICQRAMGVGIKVGPRSGPGFGRWDVAEQRALFSILPGEKIGVHLNEHCSMIPRKSLSFCVGIGGRVDGESGASPCRRCGMVDCKYRRVMF